MSRHVITGYGASWGYSILSASAEEKELWRVRRMKSYQPSLNTGWPHRFLSSVTRPYKAASVLLIVFHHSRIHVPEPYGDYGQRWAGHGRMAASVWCTIGDVIAAGQGKAAIQALWDAR